MYYYLTSVKPLPALPDKEEGVIKGNQDEGTVGISISPL